MAIYGQANQVRSIAHVWLDLCLSPAVQQVDSHAGERLMRSAKPRLGGRGSCSAQCRWPSSMKLRCPPMRELGQAQLKTRLLAKSFVRYQRFRPYLRGASATSSKVGLCGGVSRAESAPARGRPGRAASDQLVEADAELKALAAASPRGGRPYPCNALGAPDLGA